MDAKKKELTPWELRKLLLSARRLPSSITDIEAGILLGFTADEIGILVSLGLLAALGNPPPEAPKHFATTHIQERGEDVKWLDKARKEVRLFRKEKNARYKAKQYADAAISFEI